MIRKNTLMLLINRIIIPYIIILMITKFYYLIFFKYLENQTEQIQDLSMLIYVIFSIIISIFFINYYKQDLKIFTRKDKSLLFYLFFALIFTYLYTFIIQFRFYNLNPINFNFSLNDASFSFLFFIIFIILDPINEELFFRQVILDYFVKKRLIITGIIVNSFLFVLGHFLLYHNYNYIQLIDFFLMSVTFSIIRLRFGLLFSIIAHSFMNFTGLLFDNKIIDVFILDYFRNKIIFWWIWGFGVLIYIMLLFGFLYNIKKYKYSK